MSTLVDILDACPAPPKPVDDNPFATARAFMAQTLADDEGLRIAYEANVAMLLHDRFNKADFTDHATRNKAAQEILHLVFYS